MAPPALPGDVAPRTPSWNRQATDRDWFVAAAGVTGPFDPDPMDGDAIAYSDIMFRRRVQALQTVDEMLEKLESRLTDLGVLDDTFIVYASDNGYHLGQFRIPDEKMMPYDSDLR